MLTMAEYIERDALLEKVKELSNTYSYCGLASVHIIKAIEDALRVDVVEVVRCKDCKYRYFNKDCESYGCKNITGMTDFVNDNDYCSYGEKKEGAEG
jgi:hypothetical protein